MLNVPLFGFTGVAVYQEMINKKTAVKEKQFGVGLSLQNRLARTLQKCRIRIYIDDLGQSKGEEEAKVEKLNGADVYCYRRSKPLKARHSKAALKISQNAGRGIWKGQGKKKT